MGSDAGEAGERAGTTEAMGDDALDVALCAEIAARVARRQAAERLRLEDVMRAEAKKVSLP